MPKFDFQLEGVLRQRKSVERERQRQLAVVQQQMQLLQNELRDLDQTVQGANDELRTTHLTGPIDLNYLATHRRFVAATQRKAMTLLQRMALVQRQVDDGRRQLAEAAMRRKVMEKLREKQFEQWRTEIGKKETDQLDEIGGQLAYRNLTERRAEENEQDAADDGFAGGDA